MQIDSSCNRTKLLTDFCSAEIIVHRTVRSRLRTLGGWLNPRLNSFEHFP